jgi:chromosome segregation ATPase
LIIKNMELIEQNKNFDKLHLIDNQKEQTINDYQKQIQELKEYESSIEEELINYETKIETKNKEVFILQSNSEILKKENDKMIEELKQLDNVKELLISKDKIIKEISIELQNLNALKLTNEIAIKEYENKIITDKSQLVTELDKANIEIQTEKSTKLILEDRILKLNNEKADLKNNFDKLFKEFHELLLNSEQKNDKIKELEQSTPTFKSHLPFQIGNRDVLLAKIENVINNIEKVIQVKS